MRQRRMQDGGREGKRRVEMIEESILKREEKAVYALRSLYRRYGYLPYRMSKFEEYELYIRNKDFLVSDRIITFNDTNGRLLAMKPDVTLSIIKSVEDKKGCKQRVYYNENVYRVSGSTRQFKEIMQAGLECIGDIDLYDIFEVISLAAGSLALLSDSFILEISHLDLLSRVLEKVCPDKEFVRDAMYFISEKNEHDLKELCRRCGIDNNEAGVLAALVTAYGDRKKVLNILEKLCGCLFGEGKAPAAEKKSEGDACREAAASLLAAMKELSRMLDRLPFSDRILFDFSVVNDMNYYNGFVFHGFLDGVCDGILAGGQYDRMMEKMERSSGAVGFAVYLDLLEQLPQEKNDTDVDVLLLYDEGTDSAAVAEAVQKLAGEGKSVSAQKGVPGNLRYRETVDLRIQRESIFQE